MNHVLKKEMVAMLLAGGQGSRLGVLTNHVAKPAVPFGGKYRIIDFPLSNCINSGIDTVGVLTQYRPLELNSYIGNGQPWDLDRLNGGISILPPYVKGSTGEWYKGTANAIYQNLQFIENHHPNYVLILSGDHVYKMNYKLMLDHHKKTNADCTIATIRVPIEEASRFGVMNADDTMRIYEFEEKPKQPKSNLASMGVYIFTWEKLREYLEKDEADPNSENDFGKNIIPAMIQEGERMFAYEFYGYWKDVGTVESLWEANMDVIDPNVPLNLDDPPWKIYAKNPVQPSLYIGKNTVLNNVSICEGCIIEGTAENSLLSSNVVVEEGAIVSNSVLMPRVHVETGAVIEYSIVAFDAKIGKNTRIGFTKAPELPGKHREITVIGQDLTIGEGVIVPAGAMIEKDIIEEVSK